jgi:hypothetical protein
MKLIYRLKTNLFVQEKKRLDGRPSEGYVRLRQIVEIVFPILKIDCTKERAGYMISCAKF